MHALSVDGTCCLPAGFEVTEHQLIMVSWRECDYPSRIGVAAVSFLCGVALQQVCQRLQRLFAGSKQADAVQQVKETTQVVVHEAQHVSLCHAAIKKSCRDIDSATMASILAPVAFDSSLHFVDGTSHTLQYLLVLDALNFCFWPGVVFDSSNFQQASVPNS